MMTYDLWAPYSASYPQNHSMKNMQHEADLQAFLNAIEADLPPVFSRQTASKAIGGLISPKTFSNLDAKGEGAPKVKIGSKVGYERGSFMIWLEQRMKNG